ncbi:MAG: SURF1 family protein [Propionibacteriaceae bacterium]|nr:SURF1 family protein [Propionibacteriaceae bacterium]
MIKKMLVRWIVLICLIAALAYAFVQLGEWQLRRLDQRRATNARVIEHSHEDPVPYEQVMNRVMTDDDEWHVVEVTGEYTGETFQVRYRNQDGPGTEVVSPMRASDGRTVLIDRGFIPRPSGQPDPEPPAPPTGEVTVRGFVQRDEHGKDEAVVPHEYKVRLINSQKIGASLGTELVNGYVGVFESSPGDDGLLHPMALPSLDEGPHQGYAWQWFSFAVIAGIGVIVLIRADIRDYKRAQRKKAKKAQLVEASSELDA